jgi:hypothetical protein
MSWTDVESRVEATEVPQAKARARQLRRKHPTPFAFTYRCPSDLIGPLNEARFILREPSRTALMTKALTEYLRTRGIPLHAS